jgi:tetratricopeptide (TPR) repeat protein
MSDVDDKIESLIAADAWTEAREVICDVLRDSPKDHWLLSRLALTFYEQFDYETALEYDVKALNLAPRCPLALWGYAGSLEMLGRTDEAIKIYCRLVRRGAKKIASGDCGEGLARARGLMADCLYRLASCYESLGKRRQALKFYEQHLAERGVGCHSIYSLREVRREFEHLRRKSLLPQTAT